MSILVKIPKNPDFGKNCQKFSILVKIYQNLDMVIFEENIDFSQIFQKDFNFGQNFQKSRLW